MKLKFSLACAFLALAVGAAFFVMRGRESKAWKETEATDTQAAYEEFIEEFPSNENVSIAKERQAALHEAQMWDEAVAASTVDAFAEFIETFPASARIDQARASINAIVVRAACQAYLAEPRDQEEGGFEGSASADELEVIALDAQVERPGDLAKYRIALDILALACRQAGAAPVKTSFSGIQPEPGEDCMRLGSHAMSSGLSMSGTVQSAGMELSLAGIVVPPDGRLSNAIALGEGRLPINDVDGAKRNFSGNIAIEGNQSTLVAFTELPDEWVFYKTGGFGAAAGEGSGIVLPNGRGTIVRFRGRVDGYYPGYVFKGAEDYPLAFVLIDGIGLTYLCGNGSVTSASGDTWSFPPGNGEPKSR
ncbi:MAG: hypothetical protein DWQ01_09860 [Planctomycetota bacterium]|nr:MAG: hypothetical protein DWQ01_09860 [Planctomycetota bacterium]